ncbi:hypothetical protein [Segetibacter aerophilus]|uniref:Uncharacterized protein n=1 Tax=Segetibacter aerophilus TaxID=670293 RepID=A0A512BGR9_9BACT|nr:hypothetical protein [Segetibacter aerophilus]GEO11160.1 hypothetical protein SAE01_36560 [Segetibacter aerophilus]
MPKNTIENRFIPVGQGNRGEVHAEGQQADKIVNLGTNVGDINIQSATFINNTTEGRKPVSMLLTRRLIDALGDFSPRAKNFLSKIKDSEKVDWERRSDNKYLSTAKSVIVSSYASVMSVYISNLFGCENARDYFGLSIAIAKRTLQLLCFAFVSSLSDHLENEKTGLSAPVPDSVSSFFNSQTELDISEYVTLLNALVILFHQNQLKYPIAEIKNIEKDLNGESEFLKACNKLNDYAVSDSGSLPPIVEIENVLSTFLVSLNFLCAYKMISVKEISYEEVRYRTTAQYLHCYTLLGINNEKNGQKYNYDEKPLNTDAVILFKDKYQEGINLFPFIIDYNALMDEQQANICFYVGNEENFTEEDDTKTIKMLRYFNTSKISSGNDDKDIIIEFDEEIEMAMAVKPNNDIVTRYKTEDNSNKFKAMKKNEAYKAFQQAKKIITS